MEYETLNKMVSLLNKWDIDGQYMLADEPGTDSSRAIWIVRGSHKQLMAPRHAAMTLLAYIASGEMPWESGEEKMIKEDLRDVMRKQYEYTSV